MTNAIKYAAAGAATLVAVGAAAVGTTVIVGDSSSTATTTATVPAPQNLRPIEVGPDRIKVSYGPSIVGPMMITPAANGRSALISWGGSRDDLYPTGITYEFSKNGKILWTGRPQTYANVGFTLSVRKFTTCVVPHSTNGFGPKRCTTWTAP